MEVELTKYLEKVIDSLIACNFLYADVEDIERLYGVGLTEERTIKMFIAIVGDCIIHNRIDTEISLRESVALEIERVRDLAYDMICTLEKYPNDPVTSSTGYFFQAYFIFEKFVDALERRCEAHGIDIWQSEDERAESLPTPLPGGMNTERARKYFPRAIAAGLIKQTPNGYEWLHKSKTLLVIFGVRVYTPDARDKSALFPREEFEGAFGVKHTRKLYCQSLESKHPKGLELIDALFAD